MLSAFIASTLILSPATQAEGPCSLRNIAACQNTSDLLWSAGFGRALKSFLGKRRGDYLYRGGYLDDQVVGAMGGPSDDRRQIGPNLHLFTGCRAHSCPEKGAAVLSGNGQIVAVGLVNYRCGKGGCSDTPMLDLFVRNEEPDTETAIAAIRNWADTELKEFSDTLAGVEVHKLAR